MIDETDALVAELLLAAEEEELVAAGESLEELFLKFLMMDLTIRQLRRKGFGNYDILNLCRQIDARRTQNGSQKSGRHDRETEE